MPELVVLSGARAGAVFELPDMPTVVGRSPEAHFQLDDPWISSMHAMFERRGADIWVVDLESRNGTFVGAERVQEAQLQPGAVLRFGRTEVRLERRGSRARHPSSRHPTPPAVRAASRPTGRLDASTTSSGLVRGVPQPSEALPLAPRTVALLRLALHLPPATPVPGGDLIRAGLNALYRAALNEGGLVVRLGGSGALAVFGLAGPSPDDADFALRAARAAREDVSGIGAGLEVRAAVDAGEVLVGNVSGPDGFELAALGEVAERAEKVLAMAGAGEILVGPGASGASGLDPVARPRTGKKGIEVSRAR